MYHIVHTYVVRLLKHLHTGILPIEHLYLDEAHTHKTELLPGYLGSLIHPKRVLRDFNRSAKVL